MTSKLHILLVEDNPDTLRWLAMFLESLGHEVFQARNCAEGTAAARAEPFDVLLSDIGLPDGTGWDLIEGLETAPPTTIAISGLGTLSDVERSHSAGFAHHLVKPFNPAKLEAILAAV